MFRCPKGKYYRICERVELSAWVLTTSGFIYLILGAYNYASNGPLKDTLICSEIKHVSMGLFIIATAVWCMALMKLYNICHISIVPDGFEDD